MRQQRQHYSESPSAINPGYLYIFFFSIFLFHTETGKAENAIEYDNDHLSQLRYESGTPEGFSISLSLVALFTYGAEDRNGLRFGLGLDISQTIDNCTFSVGLDSYFDRQRFGLGTAYAGFTFDNEKYLGSYHLLRYFQEDRQTSGIIGFGYKDFGFRFEDDLLAFPFTGFKIQDRFRTAALELRYHGFLIGMNMYTTDIDGLVEASEDNPYGTYRNGKQISSPIYVGYAKNDLLVRLGWNDPVGGYIGQNLWHRLLFKTPDFKPGEYNNLFLQAGVDKPYTLY